MKQLYVVFFQFTPNVTENNVTTALDFSIIGKQSPSCHPVPNAFLMSLLLFFGTFLIAFQVWEKTRHFFQCFLPGGPILYPTG